MKTCVRLGQPVIPSREIKLRVPLSVSDLHYCVICLDIYQSPADLDMPLSVYAFSTSWCPSDMYIKLHLCRVLEASGSILVDIERYGICCIRS